jgi:arabinogalactan oligomer/maltooligosaccharide transport system substrate-binding protein
LRVGAGFVAAGGLAPLISACLSPADRATSSADAGASEAFTVLVGSGGDPAAVPSMQAVYDDFTAQHAGVEWDIRLLQGGGPEWDRAARATVASGEAVGFVTINGQQVRGWVRDGLLADLSADTELSTFLGRVPQQYHLTGPGEDAVRAVPLALTGGVHTTGLYFNRALLDRAEIDVPRTFADLQAAVAPLAALDVAPLVHCSGDVFFNQMLITWVLPMVAGRSGDPIEFAERTVAGEIGYDSPEWIEALQIIADLRRSGVLMEGSAAVDYATMQQLFLQGRVAMTYQGSWMLPQIRAGSPSGEFDLHVGAPPTIDGADRSRPILAWTGIGIPAASAPTSDTIRAFLEYASQPEVDQAVVEGLQAYSPIAESNVAISDELAREFLPMFDDAITPFDWLWEPEITAELDSQVQGLVRGDTEPAAAAAAVAAVADDLRASGRSYVP